MDVDLLALGLVLETDLVELAGPVLGGLGLDGALGRIVGQRVGHGLLRVVDGAGDQRAVGVAVQEGHHHLLPDAGEEHDAVILARPVLGDADPAGAFLVALAQPVPVELHLDAPVLVEPDLLAALADDDRGLGGMDARLHRRVERAEGQVRREGGEMGVEMTARPVDAHGMQDVFGVQVALAVAGHGDARPGFQRAAFAAAAHPASGEGQRLLAQLRQRLAVRRGGVAAQIVADRAEARRAFRRGVEVGRGRLEMIAADAVALGRDAPLHAEPGQHVVLVVVPFGGAVLEGVEQGTLGKGAVAVAQHQRVLPVLMREVIEDAFLFQQPGDEVVVRLPVLHAIFALAVAAGQRLLDVGVAGALADRLDDLRHRLLLEDAAVAGMGQHPQPGVQFRLVMGDLAAVVDMGQLDPPDDGVDVADRFLVAQRDGDGHRLADDAVEGDVVVRRDHGDAVGEQRRQPLLAHDGPQRQGVRSQRGGDRQVLAVLGKALRHDRLPVSPPFRPRLR